MGSALFYTAERMQAIEDGTIVSGLVDIYGQLILTKHDGTTVDGGHVVGPAAPNLADASRTVRGILELASPSDVETATDDTKAVTPLSLQALVATNSEVATGTDNSHFVTPSGLASLDASKTAQGLVQLATSAEAIAGADDAKALTAKDIADLFNSRAPIKHTFSAQTLVTIPADLFDEYELYWEVQISTGQLIIQQGSTSTPMNTALYDANDAYAGGTNATPTNGGDMNELATGWHVSPASSGSRDTFWGRAWFLHLNEIARTRFNAITASAISGGTTSSNNSTATAVVGGTHRTASAQNELYLLGNTSGALLSGFYILTRKKYSV